MSVLGFCEIHFQTNVTYSPENTVLEFNQGITTAHVVMRSVFYVDFN